MSRLADRNVLLVVGGGIAAYKCAELVRAFKRIGANVRVVMTRSGTEFITPLTLQVLSENRVGTDLFEPGFEYEIGHIETARWADVVVIAPATANLLARAARGMADDLATTVLLATTAPVLFCPAMNTQMWAHPAVQENLRTLRQRPRSFVLDPDSGELACREVGPGRLPDADVILAAADHAMGPHFLTGRSVVVTAGPTREHFDPVRFFSNPSSGRMGMCIGRAAYAAGADVTMITGPIALDPDFPCRRVRVRSAVEMRGAVIEHAEDILVMAAAVADYRPAKTHEQKQKKSDTTLELELQRNPDILAGLADAETRPRTVIGFAAETEKLFENATSKLERKRLDGIVGNSVAGPGSAFANEANRVVLLSRQRRPEWFGPALKREVGVRIVSWIHELGVDAVTEPVDIDALRQLCGSLAVALKRQGELGARGISADSASSIQRALDAMPDAGEPPAERPAPARQPAASDRSSAPSASQSAEGDDLPWMRSDGGGHASAPAPAGVAPSTPPEPETLEIIRDSLGECTRCGLCEHRTQIVFGVGNPRARLMFIGEAPGYHEDKQGEPFVGKAGQLLDRMISAMGLTRSDVYIANVIKCRPPKNRDPKPDEVAMCQPFLMRQILSVDPEVIVTLGRFASHAVLHSKTAISRMRGKWHTAAERPVMPTLHPAYLLRNQSAKRDAWNDLQLVMARLGLERPQ